MAGIEASLRRSAEASSEFTRSLFADDSWSAVQVTGFVNSVRNATIATTSPSGQPHAAVVISGSVRDAIFVTVHPASVLARNLGTDSRDGSAVRRPVAVNTFITSPFRQRGDRGAP
jgi:hypothetical protein